MKPVASGSTENHLQTCRGRRGDVAGGRATQQANFRLWARGEDTAGITKDDLTEHQRKSGRNDSSLPVSDGHQQRTDWLGPPGLNSQHPGGIPRLGAGRESI